MSANDPQVPQAAVRLSPVEERVERLKAQQKHSEEVRAAADKAVPPMADPLHPQPGYVSEAKAADDKLLAEQEAQRQKDGAAAAERQGPVDDARRKVAEAESELRRAEYKAHQDARR